ncbi:phosphogluconate dehydrogenase (NAD(+)-dependent, decarboxylating) [Aestuariimicrobium sp. T2.26MG-19.2B]|uniref:phosphogluconate dehydrogenase (NAD(+)-dependent, decarboxylating) n=1 Tax=Aestuariimicrobium sp. T2.26MG-19.2B TaxID=3040679 RepID=UPI002477B8B1|nr:decarboxylating 6-phosphogluconate dehydrogenase [Aestuariimicrobium sp. T2.26MG-19.2B]CAI9403638.1 6-phosphogluconate dehydrogenase, NAD(+)-dependent, decarboxylating [Aestuariimicrobium sp. T2.26MG-19.2B]
MQLGLIGLGKMGGNMRDRLREKGHTVVGYDRNQDLSDSKDLADLVGQLTELPKVIWVMVPEQVVKSVVTELKPLLGEGDIVIDGGNSKWLNDKVHGADLAESGIHYLDVGVSGGVWGKQNGYALMVGGEKADVDHVMPIFEALKPDGEYGFVHAGTLGAGHFTKMVHNGIEYAIMQAYAEGWEVLRKAEEVTDVNAAFESWKEGTVIRSWLLDLMVNALKADPNLDDIAGVAHDSGEGRWTVQAAIDLGVPTPAISAALYARFVSQQDDSPAMKAVAAMRNQFGGHAVEQGRPTQTKPTPPTQ